MFYIRHLELTNFRCYRKYTIDFARNINIIYGKNAVGKTSLVEAVHCLGLGKSHKAATDSDMIRKGNDFALIKAAIFNYSYNDEVMLSLLDKKKKIQKNNKTISQLSEYIGYFNVVIFSPEDLDIIKGSPLERRKFLDINISQINPKYLDCLINYRKILKQRNEILKNNGENSKYDKTLLDIVTATLIKEAKFLINQRQDFLNRLNPFFKIITKSISTENEEGTLCFLPNCDVENLEKVFTERLKTDLILKTTTTGPHRDDFEVLFNNEIASIYASQGQQRTLSLSIKLALAEMIKEKSKNLVIILDDVFSELDTERQNQILKLLDQSNQIFITTTTIENLSSDILNQSRIIKIEREVEENEF